jgi:arsenite methyltransferase
MSAASSANGASTGIVHRDWVVDLLGGSEPGEGETALRQGQLLTRGGGLVRSVDLGIGDQAQTRDMFAFKWSKRNTYQSKDMAEAQIAWLDSRYEGKDLLQHHGHSGQGKKMLVLDAGMGAGFTAKLIFRDNWEQIRLVGADISTAVDIAAQEIAPLAKESFFIQCDLMRFPFRPHSFDIVISEGVIHHTPSTRDALLALARQVKPGGILALYVYAKKAPIREYTDDYIRNIVSEMPPEQAWETLEPLTKLGIALGKLNTEIEIPEDVALLGIPKGKINIQRLFYWAICKTYYRPEFSFEEMNHINFDWFTPKYAHRQTPDEVVAWCGEAGLTVEHLKVEEAGITVIARNREA